MTDLDDLVPTRLRTTNQLLLTLLINNNEL